MKNKTNIFKRIFSFLNNWYEKAFQQFEEEGYVGVVVINWLKEQAENGNADLVAEVIPGSGDNDLVLKAKLHLPALLEAYAKAHNLAIEGKGKKEVVQVVFDYINSLSKKRGFWAEISGDLIVFLADGRLSWNEAIILGQKIFWQFFNKERKLKVAA